MNYGGGLTKLHVSSLPIGRRKPRSEFSEIPRNLHSAFLSSDSEESPVWEITILETG